VWAAALSALPDPAYCSGERSPLPQREILSIAGGPTHAAAHPHCSPGRLLCLPGRLRPPAGGFPLPFFRRARSGGRFGAGVRCSLPPVSGSFTPAVACPPSSSSSLLTGKPSLLSRSGSLLSGGTSLPSRSVSLNSAKTSLPSRSVSLNSGKVSGSLLTGPAPTDGLPKHPISSIRECLVDGRGSSPDLRTREAANCLPGAVVKGRFGSAGHAGVRSTIESESSSFRATAWPSGRRASLRTTAPGRRPKQGGSRVDLLKSSSSLAFMGSRPAATPARMHPRGGSSAP